MICANTAGLHGSAGRRQAWWTVLSACLCRVWLPLRDGSMEVGHALVFRLTLLPSVLSSTRPSVSGGSKWLLCQHCITVLKDRGNNLSRTLKEHEENEWDMQTKHRGQAHWPNKLFKKWIKENIIHIKTGKNWCQKKRLGWWTDALLKFWFEIPLYYPRLESSFLTATRDSAQDILKVFFFF